MKTDTGSARLAFLAVLAAAMVAGFVFLDANQLLRDALGRISSLGPWGPVLFVGIYVVATVLFVPGLIPTLGGGALFGVVKGSILVSISATTAATCAFLIGRYLARGWVSGKIRGNQKFEAIDGAVAREGWKIVGLTRLSPAFPFNLLNYAYGLTQVSFRDYLLASWIGMLPGTIMYVYIGSLAGDLASLGTGERDRTPAEWALLVLGLAATVVVTVFVTRIARRALDQKVG